MAYVFLAIFLSVFGGFNFYVGLRGWQWLQSFDGLTIHPAAYWSVFALLVSAVFLARMTARSVPLAVTTALTNISAWWMAVAAIAVQALIVVDLLRLAGYVARLAIPAAMRPTPGAAFVRIAGIAVCVVVAGTIAFGFWRARTPVITRYNVNIETANKYNKLRIAVASDLHLGVLIGNGRIRQLVGIVNELKPDLILIPGDLIDDDLRPFIADNMAAQLAQLQAPLGKFASLGNHDPTPANLATYRAALAPSGIQLLADEWALVDDAFYVAARHDTFTPRRAQSEPAPLEDVLQGTDRDRPVIVMDHQPNRLDDAVAAGVDLLIAGHTHRGQIFPGNLITKRIFEIDWGYLQKHATHIIVSTGFGTWGPPIRIGNRPEVVCIDVIFGGGS